MTGDSGPRPLGRVRRERESVRRPIVQQVKLNQEEQNQLRARAEELGVSVPRLLVEGALGGPAGLTPERQVTVGELFEVRRLLATVANNINQMARTANSTGETATSDRLEQTLAEVDELIVGLRAATGVRR